MKKVLSAIGTAIGTLFGILILILVGVGFLVYLPFDYIKYKRSRYCKDLNLKYTPWYGLSNDFKLYNAAVGLPIEYIRHTNGDGSVSTFFVYKDILLLSDNGPVVFERELGCWMFDHESPDENDTDGKSGNESPESKVVDPDPPGIRLEDEMSYYLEKLLKADPSKACSRAVVLADVSSDISEEDRERAEACGLFLLYDGDMAMALKDFVRRN